MIIAWDGELSTKFAGYAVFSAFSADLGRARAEKPAKKRAPIIIGARLAFRRAHHSRESPPGFFLPFFIPKAAAATAITTAAATA